MIVPGFGLAMAQAQQARRVTAEKTQSSLRYSSCCRFDAWL